MADPPYPNAQSIRTSYENIVATCPHCSRESILNRASDLQTFRPIAGLDVTCHNEECGQAFRITGDSVNNAHEMLIFDCYELLERKHYRDCILSLCQAYEVFFSLFFRVKLLYQPFGIDPRRDIGELNHLAGNLQKKLKQHAFGNLRALFLDAMVNGQWPANMKEAEAAIGVLPVRPQEPNVESVEALADQKLASLLKVLKAVDIHEQRNRVVHSQAYRPTLAEVETALKTARSTLLPLTSHLGLLDDINWYRR